MMLILVFHFDTNSSQFVSKEVSAAARLKGTF